MQALSDLNDLRFIAAITETGSLTAAAKRLGVNHATVFRRVVHSEAQLGVRLFERSAGRYSATPAGEELARAGAMIEQTAADSLRKVVGQDLRPSGSVRITTTDSVLHSLLPPVLRLCRQRYPDIHLQVVISNEMYDLSKRDADIAIRPSAHPPEHLIGKRIGAIEFAVYGALNYLAQHSGLSWHAHEWIALDRTQSHHRSLDWLVRCKAVERVTLCLNSFGGVSQACVAGLGLAVLPSFLGDRLTELQRVTAPIEDAASELWLLTHPDLRDTTRVKVILQLLHQELGQALSARFTGALPSPDALFGSI